MTDMQAILSGPRADWRPWPPHNKTVAQVWAEEAARRQRLDLDDWGRERQYRHPHPTTRESGR